jgi:hypothetical protein
MKWKHVRILFGVSLCLTAVLATRPKSGSGDLSGTGLTTLVFVGRRPIQAVITFEHRSATSSEEPGQGRWTRINTNEFSVEFRLPAELKTDPNVQYRLNGTLKLDREQGRLRGPISGDVLDANGTIIDTLHGVAKAIRISPKGQNTYLERVSPYRYDADLRCSTKMARLFGVCDSPSQ